ncbi:MAG: UbiA prenyltransferase family protein [Phycisphaerae bacterium]|nr:UbiA prenyltransferase family protein [Phycisphaerae bacterium]
MPTGTMSQPETRATEPSARPALRHFIRLARPHQWVKGAFVAVGPAYAFATGTRLGWASVLGVAGAVLAFGLAASSCYVVNDIRDREADRLHPRKRHRPIASGAVSVSAAGAFAVVLLIGACLACLLTVVGQRAAPATGPVGHPLWLGVTVLVYVLNTNLYSVRFKHEVVLDVISLAAGFVLRVLGGCAAAGVAPSAWLLNVTFFVSMFLAFGKRLGERRTMGEAAAGARGVQAAYTDELLRMSVVVTGVATLVTYAGYVQAQAAKYEVGFNALWLTMLPATYGLLRCIVVLERGVYDDPTELAWRDRPFQAAVVLFGALTVGVMVWAARGGVGA